MLALMAKAKRQRPPTEQVTVRISKPLLDKIARIGEPFGTTQSDLIRRALEEFVQRHELAHPLGHQPRR
jgi:hypothetical protein